MTERLYHADSYVSEFDATVVDVTSVDGRNVLVLDRTHFYPTSGGQPFDTGMLAGLPVIDVAVVDGAVFHIVDGDADEALCGQSVHGAIDWPRRYDHMQQHAGQHLLSQTFYQLLGYETLSVHFGAAESTLDLDCPALSEEELRRAEHFANQQVYANLAIHAYLVADAELDRVPLRRPPKVSGQIRIVEIEGFDYSACGGTHCRRTGELGPIKLLRQTRQNRKARISFICGWRALEDYEEKHRLLNQAANLFDNEIGQVPTLIARCREQAKEAQRRIDALAEQLLPYEGADLARHSRVVGDVNVITHLYEDREMAAVKQLAAMLVEEPNRVAFLGNAADDKLTLIFARSQDVPLHMGDLLRRTLQHFGGGGGGRPDFAQGGGASAADGHAALAFAVQQLVDAHGS